MPRAKNAPLKTCKRCGREYPPHQPKQQEYCGRTCRQAAYLERKKCPHCGKYLNSKPKFKRTQPGKRVPRGER